VLLQIAAIVVPFSTAVAVAIIARLQFSKHAEKLGPIPPNVTVYSLLAQQDAQIANLNARVTESEKAVAQCEEREKSLLQRLGLGA
jgi:hypothetical protein